MRHANCWKVKTGNGDAHLSCLKCFFTFIRGLGDHLMIARTAERLVRLQPRNPDGWMMMAQGYMFCGRAAMAANAWRHFLERWPGHENAVKARKAEKIASDAAVELLTDLGFSKDDFDWLVLHDEILFEISAGEFEDAVSKCRELLKAKPEVVSARNNLALALFQLGRSDEARNVSRETVSTWPDNRFAEALHGRIEFLTGHAAEANAIADRVVHDPSNQQDAVAAQVELLGFLGRDDDVLRVVKFAESIDKDPRCCALLKHFEAVALMRTGRGAEARASWKQCLELDPGYTPAAENLHDLNSSGGHAPWPDSIAKWIPKPVIDQFVSELKSGQSDDPGTCTRAIYENDLERAGELLSPLHDRPQMHISEAMAFMTASIEVAIAHDNFDAAENLLDSMKQVDPDDRRIAQLRRKIDRARQPITKALKGFISGLSRR